MIFSPAASFYGIGVRRCSTGFRSNGSRYTRVRRPGTGAGRPSLIRGPTSMDVVSGAFDDTSSRLGGAPPAGLPEGDPVPDFLDLPPRTCKPRRAGITHVLDRGLSPLALESLLETAGEHIDLIKLGWGTAYVTHGVRDKVELCRQAGVRICPGGTLLEIAVHQERLDRYLEWLRELGFDHIEVSNGSFPITLDRKREIIAELASEFTVIAETGSKGTKPAVAEEWVEEMLGDLAAGAVWVIGEGRESGTVGLFDDHGTVHADLVDAIVRALGVETLIFEAPRRSQQTWLLRHLGPNVNLGSVHGHDVIGLETLRRGLRYDTLDLLPDRVPAARAGADI
jgi:phosphosulfolactate synthase